MGRQILAAAAPFSQIEGMFSVHGCVADCRNMKGFGCVFPI